MEAVGLSELERAKRRLGAAAPFLIEQDWNAYTAEQHALWAELVGRRMQQLRESADRGDLGGFELVGLEAERLPELVAVRVRVEHRAGVGATSGRWVLHTVAAL